MGWIQKCLETYENNLHMAGVESEGQSPLSPVGFALQKAQIEVTLKEDGTFLRADTIHKNEAKTLIPVTETSASRSSGISPHPLCDQLCYCVLGHANAPDCEQYKEKYLAFINGLKSWKESRYSHFIVDAVYNYCVAGSLVNDLVGCGILKLDEGGKLMDGKIDGNPYDKCLVRWRVIKPNETGGESWKDSTFFESYFQYLSSQLTGEIDVCYATGQKQIIATSHPKGTLANAFGAKLVSANDSAGFTYRGRFETAEEAMGIGYSVSQKAHGALRWLVANQGVYLGGRNYVCWNPKGKKTPKGGFQLRQSNEEEKSTASYTMTEYRKMIKEALDGYRLDLGENEDVIIMGLDAATTGRLSIVYYNELLSSDFLKRLERWYETCCWWQTFFTEQKERKMIVATPTINKIVKFAFGTQQGEIVAADDKVIKEHSQRVLHCIVDSQPIPKDIINALTQRASLRQAYNQTNYNTLLSTACAMIRKYRNDLLQKEEWKMELDQTNKDRSYLFGRLFAVLEKVERVTYTAAEQGREPNACRLQTVFVQRPMNTWKVLDKALVPYFAKLRPGAREYYKNLIGEIISMLESPAELLNRPLEDTYLLGYYLQRKELNTYVKNDTQNLENLNSEEN